VVGGQGRCDRPHHHGEAVHRTVRGPYGAAPGSILGAIAGGAGKAP
jgi:hypothetical protein